MIFQKILSLIWEFWNILFKKILVYRIIKYIFFDQWISILCLQYPIIRLYKLLNKKTIHTVIEKQLKYMRYY